MTLSYGKNKWEIASPSASSLLNAVIKSETNKTKLSKKQVAKILYSLNISKITWADENYSTFIKSLDEALRIYYMTNTKNTKQPNGWIVTRQNINFIKNDFSFLHDLFSNILSTMVSEFAFGFKVN